MITRLHALLLVGVPLAFSVLLWLHPMIGDYEGLRDVTARFQIVHVAMVLTLPLLALGRYLTLDGLGGRAATTARVRSPMAASNASSEGFSVSSSTSTYTGTRPFW